VRGVLLAGLAISLLFTLSSAVVGPEARRAHTRLEVLEGNTTATKADTKADTKAPPTTKADTKAPPKAPGHADTKPAAPAGGCTVPDVPAEFIVASVPGRDGEFQVVHRLKSNSELKTKFSHYGHIHVKPTLDAQAMKSLNSDKYMFQWTDSTGATVMTAKTDGLKPWKPLDVRDCNGKMIAAMAQAPAPAKTTFFKYTIADGSKKEVGATNPTDLKNDVIVSDNSGAEIARIHPELMGSHQTVTILAKEGILSDVRMLVYIAANKGMARSKHAEQVEVGRRKVALGFLSKICIAVGAVLLLAAVACALSCKYGLIDIGSGYTEDVEQQSLVKSRPAAAMSR